MADMQRPGRVGGDELDLDALGALRAAAVIAASVEKKD